MKTDPIMHIRLMKTDPIMHIRLTENCEKGRVFEGSFRKVPLETIITTYQHQGGFKRFEVDIISIGRGCPKKYGSFMSVVEFLQKIGIKTY